MKDEKLKDEKTTESPVPTHSPQPPPDDFLDIPDFLLESTMESGRKGGGGGGDGGGGGKSSSDGKNAEGKAESRKLLLGIGNDLKGDDAAGVLLARRFRGKGWRVEDCGTVPENFTAIVRRMRPGLTVLVDASIMGLEPGEIRKVPPEKIEIMNFSTHSLPLTLFMDYIEKYSEEIVLLGIEPKNTELFAEVSSEVEKAIERLAGMLESGEWREIEDCK